MRATINGIRYNTDNAKFIGAAGSSSHDVRDAWSASLYKTSRASHYFLAGQGGPMSLFAGGSKITPLSADEAREWAVCYLTHAEVEAAFGPLIVVSEPSGAPAPTNGPDDSWGD
jgi:hypothetical protein